MEMSFPDGVRVDATFRGHTMATDQPIESGGTGTAPAPFDLFLASIGTCAAFYILRFCQGRGIDTANLGVTLEPLREGDGKHFSVMRIVVTLPAGFPAKYHRAITRAVDQCAVKRHIVDSPRFETILEEV
jgi:ribosomal protein S12 methylthiotransferase accessory factor